MPRIANTLGQVLGATMAAACVLALLPGAVRAVPSDPARDVERVLQLTNAQRSAVGVAPLAFNAELSAAAQKYSQVLASGACFEHVCGSVPNFADRLTQAGYTGWTSIGENIAGGYPTPEAVVAGWMASSGHRANILSADYAELGVGVVGGGKYGTYWTQEFGTRAQASQWADADTTDARPQEQP